MGPRDVLRRDTNSLASDGFRLLTLGTVTLVDAHGIAEPTLARRRRKLAVLAVLALARTPVGRDKLSEMFWGDEEGSRARHSLADTLSNLRRVLGPDSLANRQLEIALSPDCPLTVDALDLVEAYERQDFARVIELYGGPFLDGLVIRSSDSFERWVIRARNQFHRKWVDACARHCLTLARGRRWTECAAVSRRWLEAEPLSSDAALYLINSVKAPATATSYAAALAEFGWIEQRLLDDFGRAPADEIVRLADSIREQLGAREPEHVVGQPIVEGVAPPSVLVQVDRPDALTKPIKGRSQIAARVASLALAALLFMTSTSFTAVHPGSSAAEMGRPVIAVVDIRSAHRDASTTWLEQTVPQLLASQVSRVPGVDVVAPDFVHEARAAIGVTRDRKLSSVEMDRIGRRVGARWVAVGSVRRDNSGYTLDLIVRETGSGVPIRVIHVSHTDLIALADQAGSMLASVASFPARR